jgi:quercetin dioxygenase-like cupin family protein
VKFLHLFSGNDGQSHIESMTLESHPTLNELHAVKGVWIQTIEGGHFLDWHHAPRRQYVIMLSGEMEIGLGDGSMHQLGPGDVLFAEDLTGQGHTRRVTSDKPRISATVPLA